MKLQTKHISSKRQNQIRMHELSGGTGFFFIFDTSTIYLTRGGWLQNQIRCWTHIFHTRMFDDLNRDD